MTTACFLCMLAVTKLSFHMPGILLSNLIYGFYMIDRNASTCQKLIICALGEAFGFEITQMLHYLLQNGGRLKLGQYCCF